MIGSIIGENHGVGTEDLIEQIVGLTREISWEFNYQVFTTLKLYNKASV